MRRLAQLVLGWISLDEACEQILLVVRVGGPALAGLYRLRASANGWLHAGRPQAMLLSGSDVDTALELLAPAATVEAWRGAAAEFVGASAARRQRTTHRLISVALAAAVVLSLVAETAGLQRISAVTHTASMVMQRDHADSVRLAGLATDLIGTDPDLPWLLAERALAAAPTIEAWDAARRVLTAVPPHRVVALPGLPGTMASDPPSGRLAIAYTDGSVEIRSGTDGQLLRTVPAEPAASDVSVYVALAPGGDTLAMIGGTVRLVATADGHTVRSLDPGQEFWGWSDAEHVLVSKPGEPLSILDVTTGVSKSTQVSLTSSSSAPRAYSTSPTAHVANLLDGDRLISIDLTTGQALPPVQVAGATASSSSGTIGSVASLPSSTFSQAPWPGISCTQ